MGWYPETMESQSGKTVAALYPTPGLAIFCTLPDTPIRGQIYNGGRAFAVGGSYFCEVLSNGTLNQYGPIATDGKPVSMAGGTTQILVASAGFCYVFDMTANTFNPIPSTTLTGVSQVGYCDGFFLALLQNSHTFQASALLDATTWPGLSISSVNVFVDNILSMLVDHRQVWLFGITKSVVYYDSGNFPFPFDVVPGGFVEQGIGAMNSAVRLDNSVFWIGGDERGNAVAWRATGYTPTRVSNNAVEFAWQGYSTISDAVAYPYQDQGHSFWVIYFPTANKTWVYDAETQQWHERGFWKQISGIYTAHRSQNHIFAFNQHLVGDWASGNIYTMSINTYTDAGNPIRRVRRAPHVSTENEWIFHHQLQIDMETGLGPEPPLLQGGNYDSTRIQTSGGAGTNKYGYVVGVSVLSANYTLGVLVMNNSAQTLQVFGDLFGSVYVPSGAIQQVTMTGIGDGATNANMFFGAAAPGDNLDITVVNPQIDQAGINQIPSGNLNFTGWSAINGATITLTQGLPTPGSSPRDPEINLRWSDDGGHTWSNIHTIGVGQMGKFLTRVIWRRLGRSRDRVYEVSVSDPIPWRLLEADLIASPGFVPQERLAKTYTKVS